MGGMRRVYYYDKEAGRVVEGAPRRASSPKSAYFADERFFEGKVAPDGTDISSRTKFREYCKLHGVTDPRDYTETWAKADAERAAFAKGEQPLKPYIESVEESMRMLNQGYKPPPPPVAENDMPVIHEMVAG